MHSIDITPLMSDPARLHSALVGLHDAELTLAPGRYDLYADRGVRRSITVSNSNMTDAHSIGVLLEGLRGVRLNAPGAQLVCHGQFLPLALMGCADVSISGLTIDWAKPLTAEGDVLRAGDGCIDVRIDPAMCSFDVRGGRLYFSDENGDDPCDGLVEYNGVTGRVQPGSGDGIRVQRVERLTDDTVRLTLASGSWQPLAGNVLALRHALRVSPGVLIHDCTGVTLDDLRLHCCAGLGILSQFSRDITLLRVTAAPNAAAGRRVAGCHDDGFHFSNVGGHIEIRDCATYALNDDPVNVHGTALRIAEVIDPRTLRAEFVHHQSVGFGLWARPGDEIGLIAARTMHTVGTVRAVSFRLDSMTGCTIALDADLPQGIGAGDALENLTNTASVHISGCHFGANRARGTLITTPQPVVVEECLFESPGAQILLAGDANGWYESGACRDVTIRRNVFTDSGDSCEYQFGGGMISITPEIPEPDQALPFHGWVRICDNTFMSNGAPLVKAFSVARLEFTGNRVMASRALTPQRASGDEPMYVLDKCVDVDISDNRYIGCDEGALLRK